MTSFKVCFKCHSEKPISEFYKHPQMADGHLGKCKECTKLDSTTHRNEKIEEIRAYDRERSKLPERIKSNTENVKRYREKHAKRYQCNCAVNNAIRDGRLSKLPCFICGSLEVEAHHADYDQPLDVVWLCAVHHKEIHLKGKKK